MSALWFVAAWVGVSVLCVVFFAIGAALGYRRGWDDRGSHARAVQRPLTASRSEAEWLPGERVRVFSR